MTLTAVVTSEAVQEIVRIGLERAPQEACGLLTFDGSVLELENLSQEPEDSFEMTGAQMAQAALAWAELTGHLEDRLDLIVWHTHPSGRRGPSSYDLKHREPGVKYLVVTLDGDAQRY